MSIVVYVLTDTHHVHACMGLWHVFTQTHMHAHTHMHSTKKEYLSSFNKNKQNLKAEICGKCPELLLIYMVTQE